MVYHRLIGEEYGPQMPPKGALGAEQIAIIKAWIDQGADWPDALANEIDLPPLNPKAVAMVEALRNDDLPAFMKAAQADPKLLNARGPEGSTPFMYAVLYSDTETLAKLLKMGADPNKRNDANATALMWAARDLEKTRLLVEHGADVNARSDDRRTPLMIAARRPGAAPIVKFLLDKGANPNPNAKPAAESSPLLEALTAGDAAIVKLLIERGADAKAAADMGLTMAVTTKCDEGLELLAAKITDKQAYTLALQNTAVFGDLQAVRLMLDHGADVNAFDPIGRTPLMYAAISDVLPLDVVKLLIERGADVNAKRQAHEGRRRRTHRARYRETKRENADCRFAGEVRRQGQSGDTCGAAAETATTPSAARFRTACLCCSARIPILRKMPGAFPAITTAWQAMALGLARKRGLRIDEQTAAAQVRFNVQALEALRDKMHQGYVFRGRGHVFGFRSWLPVGGASRRELPGRPQYGRRRHAHPVAAEAERRMALSARRHPPADLPRTTLGRPPLPCVRFSSMRPKPPRPSVKNRFVSPLPGWPRRNPSITRTGAGG